MLSSAQLALDCGAGFGTAVRNDTDMNHKPLLHSLQRKFDFKEHSANAEIG